MNTKFNICVTVLIIWTVILLAAFGIGKALELVINGWPALASLLGIMIGGKTFERVRELTGKAGA
jgi:hypothetical protein